MKLKILILFLIIFNVRLFGSGNMTIDTFPTGITGWNGAGWNATGGVYDETTYIYEGTHSLRVHYKITSAWGNYAGFKLFTSPMTNWTGYKYLIFYVSGSTTKYDANNSFEVDIYTPDTDSNSNNDEVWYYSDKSLLKTKYFKQVKIKLESTNNGGDFMDVDWDDDLYGNSFVKSLSNLSQISFLASGAASGTGEGDFWLDNIYITSNDTFSTATLVSPEHTTGLSQNTTVKIKIGYNMTNIVCQLVDASNNYFKYEINDSIVSYSDDIVTINFTNLKPGKNTIVIDAVNKITGVPLNQFEKSLYVSDYYILDNFESSDLTEFSTSAFEGTSVAVLSTDIHNSEYGGTKSLKLDYSTAAAWKSAGIRFTFDEAMDFSDFSVLRLYIKGKTSNNGRINVAIYDNDNNKLDLNYNEDDYCAWTGSENLINKNFWVKIDIPLNTSSFIDGNTPANNSGYQSGNQQVEFNKIESLDIYFDSPYNSISGTVYIDDIILLKHNFSFVSVNTNNESENASLTVDVNNFKPVFNMATGEYSISISVPGNSEVNFKVLGINGNTLFSKTTTATSGDIIFNWDGKANGSRVESGIYFVKIEVNNSNSNFKKTVIKRFYVVK